MTPLCNLHTHSAFCDGANTPEDIVLAAIDRGFTVLGFSSHSPTSVQGDEGCMTPDTTKSYKSEILRLKAKYSNKIEIVLGIEQDSFTTERNDGYEYVIGSVHHVYEQGEHLAVDWSYERLLDGAQRLFSGDFMRLAEAYYSELSHVVKKTDCDIIGHFDVITKYNEEFRYIDEDAPKYRDMMLSAADELLKTDAIFEVNTGGMARGRKKIPYLPPIVVKRIAQKGGKFILGSDAHKLEHLNFGFSDACEYLTSLGVTELCIWQDGGFKTEKI